MLFGNTVDPPRDRDRRVSVQDAGPTAIAAISLILAPRSGAAGFIRPEAQLSGIHHRRDIGVYERLVGYEPSARRDPLDADSRRPWRQGSTLLPNPSGLNAHYQLDGLVAAFAALREAAW